MQNDSSNRESSATTHSPLASRLPLPLDIPGADPNQIVSLSDPQEQALEWLISGGSITEAAQFAGVTRQTISRWLRTDADFRAVYEAWKRESQEMLEARLIAAGDSAMDTMLQGIRMKGSIRASEFVLKTLLAKKAQAG
jgi:hypothetical protein